MTQALPMGRCRRSRAWYIRELQRLVKYKIPTLILPTGQAPTSNWDFKPHASPCHSQESEYIWMDRGFKIQFSGLKVSSLRILRILARLQTAHTPEITSLAGFSQTYVRTLWKELRADKLIEWKKIGKYDGWAIRNKGLSLA